jgi:LuxR family maltose regulon positive regulatory protein
MELARLWNHWEVLVPGALGQAHLKQRAGETQAALEILKGLDSPPIENMALPLEACAALYEAERGNRDLAAAWLAAHSGNATLMPDPTNEAYLLEVASTMTALQRYDEALALLQKLIAYAGERGRAHLLVRARVARTSALAMQGKKVEAFAGLLTCLPSAATEGYVSTFVDQGEVLHKLLLEVREQAPAGLKAYIEKILQGFQPVGNPPARRGLELSEREQEILSLVAAGLSNQEIAGRLVISITTVKTHLGNIFNKLGVTSRTQALSRAGELGLLPRS